MPSFMGTTSENLKQVRKAAALVAVAMSLYQVYVAQFGEPVSTVHRPLHLMFAFVVLFWAGSKKVEDSPLRMAIDGFFIVLTVAATAYLFLDLGDIQSRIIYVSPLVIAERVLSVCLIVAIIEAARRTVGPALMIIVACFLLYAWLGSYLPYPFWHRGMTVDAILEQAYLTSEGIWGVPIGVVASYVFLFVLFGSLLMASGAGTFFTDLARALTGRLVGGTAKTSVVSSALMGMLSGSSVANVVTTGSFTIPAMRKAGYDAKFAAGVEAVASSGSQLTPPIMGAAAFIMMEFLGVEYSSIMEAALMPAALYFLAIYVTVHLEARKENLPILSHDMIPRLGAVLKRQGYLVLSIAVMIWLLFEGYTPARAGLGALMSLVVLLILFDPKNRGRIGAILWEAATTAPRLIAPVSVACATGGLIVGIISQTGLGLRVSDIVLLMAGESLFLTLFLTMICSVILGMGLPTSGAYIILAVLLAPGIIGLGVPEIAAHMFIIYCASKSGITPPVAIASFAAAAVANTDPWRTSLTAFRIGLSIFIIPYMFVYGPELLGRGTLPEIVLAFATAAVGVTMLSSACVGWFFARMTGLERIAAFASAGLLIHSGLVTDISGAAVAGTIALWSWTRRATPTEDAAAELSGKTEPRDVL